MKDRRMKKKHVEEATLGDIKRTLDTLDGRLGGVEETLGFVVEHMATKEDLNDGLFKLQTQINGIESGMREMRYPRLEDRVEVLEEKVFGKAR